MAVAIATDVLENALLDHVNNRTAMPQPTNLYIGLSQTDPGESGSRAGEPSGGSYAPVAIDANWTISGRAASNSTLLQWPQATANWGTITWSFICRDDPATGDILARAQLDTPQDITTGRIFESQIGELDYFFSSGGGVTTFVEALLNHFLMGSAMTQPSTFYTELHIGSPGDDGLGGTVPSGGGYGRAQVTSWTAASNGSASNASAVTFPQATGDWGLVDFWSIYDAPTGGNQLWYGGIVPPPSGGITSGQTLRWPTNNMVENIQ